MAVAWSAGGCTGPTPLATASIVVKESLGSSIEEAGSSYRAVYPPKTVHVCVTCPECAEDAKLQLTFLGIAGSTEPVNKVIGLHPVCGPDQFELWAKLPFDAPTGSTVEVSDGNSAIRATFSDAPFAPRTVSYPGPGTPPMCVGSTLTLDWSPASDLPETPITGNETTIDFYEIMAGCMSECSGGGGFTAALTADPSGVHFTVPPYRGGIVLGGGALYATLPTAANAEPEPALRCDGGIDCGVYPFRIAIMNAGAPHTCSP